MVSIPIGIWDESQIRESLHIFADSPPSQLPRCASGGKVQSRVIINADTASVLVVTTDAPSRMLTLREGLLPEVHYLPDGRHALLATRNGWVMRADLEQARLVAEVRVGLVLHRTALSAAQSSFPIVLAVANASPHTLAVLDEQLTLIKLLRVVDKTGHTTSPIAEIKTDKARNSFVATLKDVPELWEISYNPKAPDLSVGLVHDFQYREGAFLQGYLNPQRTMLASPAPDFLLVDAGHEVLTAHANFHPPDSGARIHVTHLDVRRTVAEFALPGWPALSRSFAWTADGQDRLAVPDSRTGLVSVIDSKRWTLLSQLRTDSSARFLSSAPDSPPAAPAPGCVP